MLCQVSLPQHSLVYISLGYASLALLRLGQVDTLLCQNSHKKASTLTKFKVLAPESTSSHYTTRILFLVRKILNTIKAGLEYFLTIGDLINSINSGALCSQISRNCTPLQLFYSVNNRPTLRNIFLLKRPVFFHLGKKYPTFTIVLAAAYHVSLS